MPLSLQPDGVNSCYFEFLLFNEAEFIVGNDQGLAATSGCKHKEVSGESSVSFVKNLKQK